MQRFILQGSIAMLVLLSSTASAQNIVVLLDDSASMKQPLRSNSSITKIDAAKQALLTILERAPEDSQVGVMVLNGHHGQDWVIPLAPINKATLTAKVNRIRPGGGTPLGESMKSATDALLALRNQEHYGDYRLLIVTDGEATDPDLVEAYLPDILARSITVDVIGVDMARTHSLATRVDNYRKADNPASLTQAIEASLAERTADDQNADETSDFELLQGWPDDLAMPAIETLTLVNNDPIVHSSDSGFQTDWMTPTDVMTPKENADLKKLWEIMALLILFIVVSLFFLGSVFFAALSRSAKKKSS